jgi:iron complex outermembrane receptor protein
MRVWWKSALVVWVLTLTPPAAAEEIEDFAELDLEELLEVNVHSAAKHEQDIGESPSAISVISREQIENTACTDVFCLLRQVPEVDVEWLRMMYISIGARALTDALCDKGLVLVDGREINDEIFGVVYWMALPVHLDEIERIEVIRGPGSALYGANAHSLVVSASSVICGRSCPREPIPRATSASATNAGGRSAGSGCCSTTRRIRPDPRWTPALRWPRGHCTPPLPRPSCMTACWPTCSCATSGTDCRRTWA